MKEKNNVLPVSYEKSQYSPKVRRERGGTVESYLPNI